MESRPQYQEMFGMFGGENKKKLPSSLIWYDWKTRIYLKELVCSLIKLPVFLKYA